MSWRASSGIRAWIIQRSSAVYLACFIVFIVFSLGSNPHQSVEAWRSWVAQPLINTGLGLFFLSLLLHGWIGLRDVVMDYVNPWSLRLFVLLLFALIWLGMGLWVVRILYTVPVQ